MMPSNDWQLFLSLERDLATSADYVAITVRHSEVYSVVYLKILLAACSAIERLGKKYCGIPLEEHTNAEALGRAIVKKNPKFFQVEFSIPHYQIGGIRPWSALAEGIPPAWWSAYNASKHSSWSFEEATQGNAVEGLGGLFCLNLAYYGNEVENFPLPVLYDHPTAIPHTMTTTGK